MAIVFSCSFYFLRLLAVKCTGKHYEPGAVFQRLIRHERQARPLCGAARAKERPASDEEVASPLLGNVRACAMWESCVRLRLVRCRYSLRGCYLSCSHRLSQSISNGPCSHGKTPSQRLGQQRARNRDNACRQVVPHFILNFTRLVCSATGVSWIGTC